MEYYILALKKYAEFTGRARRKEYWMFFLFNAIFSVVIGIVAGVIGLDALAGLYSLALFVPSVAIAARRLHDIGRSGWWQLIIFVPIIGLLVMIYFLVQDSQDDNEYGKNPKGYVVS